MVHCKCLQIYLHKGTTDAQTAQVLTTFSTMSSVKELNLIHAQLGPASQAVLQQSWRQLTKLRLESVRCTMPDADLSELRALQYLCLVDTTPAHWLPELFGVWHTTIEQVNTWTRCMARELTKAQLKQREMDIIMSLI